LFLGVNHAFRALKRALGVPALLPSWLGNPLAIAGTFFAVVVAFVFFRAENLLVALQVLVGMAGLRGFHGGPVESEAGWWVAGLLAVAWLLPNSQQLLRRHDPGIDTYRHLEASAPGWKIAWEPTLGWALFTWALLLAALFAIMVEGHVEFLYRFF
jgi:hypothetical protein